jgi:predicted nucleotidyltransferase
MNGDAHQARALPPHHQAVLDRFVAACQADERMLAAVLSGSHARGTADAHSDLDLGLITTDAAYENVVAARDTLVRRLGEPVFLEPYDGDHGACVLFILADGTEGEVSFGRAGHFTHMHQGPYRTLLDKTGLLQGVVFEGYMPPVNEQMQTLHGLIYWFWHDLNHHFLTPLARKQLWSAAGALEDLRLSCVNLARLRYDFSARADGFEKVEDTPAVGHLAPLRATYGPLEPVAMLRAARVIVQYFRELAMPLAQAHGIAYPFELDRMMSERLEGVCQARG